MQTFLPYQSFATSALVLDFKRLGKQRVETLQILQVLLGERLITSDKVVSARGVSHREPRPRDAWERQPLLARGWRNHPAVLMWQGHELGLLAYQEAICAEWGIRGYRDSCLEKTEYLLEPHRDKLQPGLPAFVGNEEFHESHRSNLLRKDSRHYSLFWPKLSSTLPYIWPKSD